MRERQNSTRGQAAPTLVISYGSAKRKTRPLDRDLFLLGGSASADIHLVSPDIAAVHCLLARGEDGWMVRDCGSRLGTRLNGRLIQEARLSDGDVLQIGPFSFQLQLPADYLPASSGAPLIPFAETPPPSASSPAGPDTATMERLEQRIVRLENSRRCLAEHALRYRRLSLCQAEDLRAVHAASQQMDTLRAELCAERERLTVMHDTLEARALQLAQQEQELARRQAHFERDAAECQRRQDEADAELAAQRADFDRRIATLSREEACLAEREATLVAAAAEAEAQSHELATLHARLHATERENQSLQQQLAAAENKAIPHVEEPVETVALSRQSNAWALDRRQAELSHFARHLQRWRAALDARERELSSRLDPTERLPLQGAVPEAEVTSRTSRELDEREQRLSDLERTLAEARAEVERERAAIEAARVTLEAERAAVAQVATEREHVHLLLTQLAEQRAANEGLELRLNARAEELVERERQLTARQNEIDEALARESEQQLLLSEQQRELELRQREAAECAASMARERAALHEERARWAREQEEHAALLRAKQEEIARQQTELRQQRAETIQELAALRAAKQAAVGPDREAITAEIEELRRQIALRDSHIEALVNEANTEIGRLEAVADHYRQQAESIAAERDALAQAAPDELPRSLTQEAPSEDPAVLKQRIAERESALEELRQELELYKRGLETSGGYEAEISRARQELARDRKLLEREQSELIEQREALEEAIREMELQMARERAQIARDRVELQRLRDEACMERERLERLAPIRERLASVQRFKSELLGKGES